MANYANLKNAIISVIRQNGNNEITGQIMQNTLLSIINAIGTNNYQFIGVATPSTNPGTPDANVFYLAAEPGTYSNFNGFVLQDKMAIFWNVNGGWTYTELNVPIYSDYIKNVTENIIDGVIIDYGDNLCNPNYIPYGSSSAWMWGGDNSIINSMGVVTPSTGWYTASVVK